MPWMPASSTCRPRTWAIRSTGVSTRRRPPRPDSKFIRIPTTPPTTSTSGRFNLCTNEKDSVPYASDAPCPDLRPGGAAGAAVRNRRTAQCLEYGSRPGRSARRHPLVILCRGVGGQAERSLHRPLPVGRRIFGRRPHGVDPPLREDLLRGRFLLRLFPGA